MDTFLFIILTLFMLTVLVVVHEFGHFIVAKAALDMGMVQIAIVEPKHSFTAVEDALTARFGLKKATVLPDVVGNRDILRRDICAALAEDLGRVVANGSVVGVAWGNTMSTLGKVLSKTDRQGVSVIQLNGGLSKVLAGQQDRPEARRPGGRRRGARRPRRALDPDAPVVARPGRRHGDRLGPRRLRPPRPPPPPARGRADRPGDSHAPGQGALRRLAGVVRRGGRGADGGRGGARRGERGRPGRSRALRTAPVQLRF